MVSSPSYPLPLALFLRVLMACTSGQKRSFHRDVAASVARISPPVRVLGAENIPVNGPCLLTCNHYYRPGFDAWWIAMALSAALPVEIRWIITAERRYEGMRRGVFLRPLERRFLACVARVYGHFAMPAMPPDPRESQQRARVVRQVIETIRSKPDAVIGLAPEGRDIHSQTLGRPPAGAGRFMLRLVEMGMRIIPVGVYEADGVFCLHFGAAYSLSLPAALTHAEVDQFASRQVMLAIGRLVPLSLRGEFTE